MKAGGEYTAPLGFAWLDSEKIDFQLVATWPDIYGYGLSDEKCAAWHRLLNNTLAAWCNENAKRFGLIASRCPTIDKGTFKPENNSVVVQIHLSPPFKFGRTDAWEGNRKAAF